jgi:hypothetical protein
MPRTFIDKNGGYQTNRTGVEKLAHDTWVDKSSWGLSRDDLIRLSYFNGNLEYGSDGSSRKCIGNEPGDVVYIAPNGSALTRSMVTYLFNQCDDFMYGYITCYKNFKL